MATKKLSNDLDALDGLNGLDSLDGLDGLDTIDGPTDSEFVPGSLQETTRRELSEYEAAFKARAQAESKRMELATDSEYWTCLVFQTREQAEAFAAAVPWLEQGAKYVDGVQVARSLGIELPPAAVPYNTSSRKDKKLNKLT